VCFLIWFLRWQVTKKITMFSFTVLISVEVLNLELMFQSLMNLNI